MAVATSIGEVSVLKILIVARPGDPHLRAITWGLRKLGHSPTIWYWDEFPKRDSAYLRLGGNDQKFALELDGITYSEPFDAIWVRRMGEPVPVEGSHPDDVGVIRLESKNFIDNLLPHLGHATTRWVNHPYADYRCRNKSDQLLAAKAAGFRIPETLIGNDMGAVRNFFDQQRKIIHKGFTYVRWDNEDGSQTVTRTSPVHASHLANDFAVRACPGIYQKNIEKRIELRVTVIGETVIAAAIDSQRDGATTDWRCEGGRGNTNLSAIAIDPALAERCRAYCRSMGVAFGCIDLIVRPDDEVVFLEINSAGQFLFNEIADPTLPLLDTFCRYLVHGDRPPADARMPALHMADFMTEEASRPEGTAWMATARY
jgi:glutathione synthase/RimK-type ligase-like ATP-grasp enzyme